MRLRTYDSAPVSYAELNWKLNEIDGWMVSLVFGMQTIRTPQKHLNIYHLGLRWGFPGRRCLKVRRPAIYNESPVALPCVSYD